MEADSSARPREYAGLLPRALAFALDYLPIAAYLAVVAAVGFAARRIVPAAWAAIFSNPYSAELAGFLLLTLPVTLYFALSESSSRQGTWGKRRVGLAVIGESGGRISRARALARSALKFVPWELSHFLIWQSAFAGEPPVPLFAAGFVLVWLLVGANIASVLLSPTRQSLYDRLSKTWVVRGRSN